jgi:MFS family permease
MCLSQPIVSRLSKVFLQKSLVLASIMMLGIGSLLCESADAMPLLLTGRTVQGLGAGALMVISYAACVDLNMPSGYERESGRGHKFLAAISVFAAAGTVCGPFIGAALSDSHHWVKTVPLLETRELTTVPALDFPSEHTHVRGTWCARIQQ